MGVTIERAVIHICSVPYDAEDTVRFLVRILYCAFGKDAMCMSWTALRNCIWHPHFRQWLTCLLSDTPVPVYNVQKLDKFLFAHDDHLENVKDYDPIIYYTFQRLQERAAEIQKSMM